MSRKISFAPEIRLFGIEHFILEKYKKISEVLIFDHKKVLNKALFPILITSVLPEIIIFSLMIYFIRDVLFGIKSFGEFTLINGLLLTLSGSINGLISAVTSMFQDTLSLKMIRDFLSKKSALKPEGNLTLKPPFDIEFKNVSFRYPRTKNYILQNLSFSIKHMEKIFILGKNGCGKSTILKLLLRQYDVTEGEILFNGINIYEYTNESIKRCFSALFQNYDKYAFTLRENIQISNLNQIDVSDSTLLKIIKKASGEDFLKRIDANLDIKLSRIFSDDGIELSGGEIQKIAIARTIFRDTPVMLFDEPSSNLDPISEQAILNEFTYNIPQKTLIITHRLNGAIKADKIIVMDNGRIKELGSHQQLMNNKKDYYKMVRKNEE